MPRNRPQDNQSGFVLVTVLWMLIILTAIALGFSHRAMMERRMAWYGMDKAQAQSMARGAANRALLELANKERFTQYNGHDGFDGTNQRWARTTDLLREEKYYSVGTTENFEDDKCTYRIVDCDSRISLNDTPRELLESMDVFSFKAIDAILERRERRDTSAQPHRFVSVDEILTLEEAEGIDDEVWFGTAEEAGLRSTLTVWGGRTEGKININTASRRVLAQIPELDENVLERIIEFRRGEDEVLGTRDDQVFRNLRDVWKDFGVSAETMAPILKYCKTDSQWFKITTQATRRRGKISAYCTVIVEMQFGEPAIRDWKEGALAS